MGRERRGRQTTVQNKMRVVSTESIQSFVSRQFSDCAGLLQFELQKLTVLYYYCLYKFCLANLFSVNARLVSSKYECFHQQRQTAIHTHTHQPIKPCIRYKKQTKPIIPTSCPCIPVSVMTTMLLLSPQLRVLLRRHAGAFGLCPVARRRARSRGPVVVVMVVVLAERSAARAGSRGRGRGGAGGLH